MKKYFLLAGKKMVLQFQLVSSIVLFLNFTGIGEVISPEEFNHAAKMSGNIIRTLNEYNAKFETYKNQYFNAQSKKLEAKPYRPYFTYDFTGYIPASDSFSANTNYGPVVAYPQKTFLGINFGFKAKALDLGFFVVADQLDLTAFKEDNRSLPDSIFQGGIDSGLISWDKGDGIIGYEMGWENICKVRFGAVLRHKPIFDVDSTGKTVFKIDKDEFHKGTIEYGTPFGEVYYKDLHFSTLYDSKENAIDFISFDYVFRPKSFVVMNPFLNYFSNSSRFQIGSTFLPRESVGFLLWQFETALDFHEGKNGRFGLYSHHTVEIEKTFFKMSPGALSEKYRYDFYMYLMGRTSYSDDVLDKGRFGYSAEIGFENIFRFFSFSVGEYNNDYESLLYMPIVKTLQTKLHFRLSF